MVILVSGIIFFAFIMERVNLKDIKNSIMYFEHTHRYEWAARLANGFVIDVACGEGYGGEILSQSTAVSRYLGIDVSEAAVLTARENSQLWLSRSVLSFEVGNILKMDILEKSVDTVISLETLEHLEDPTQALCEVRRVLKPNGIFIGSVPTVSMENLCEKTYGKNKYHIQRFSLEDVKKLLLTNFEHFFIFKIEMNIGSLCTLISSSFPDTDEILLENFVKDSDRDPHLGSFLFVASNDKNRLTGVAGHSFYSGLNFTLYEGENVIPLRDAYRKAEKGVFERDSIIREQRIWLKVLYPIRKLTSFFHNLKR